MKSNQSNINNLTWESSILELSPSKPSQNILKLHKAGVTTILDLLWLLPLRVIKEPESLPFTNLIPDELFKGEGQIINIKMTPAFGRRGKKSIQLFNASVVIKDLHSSTYLTLKWFNCYPGLKKQLESHEKISFLGKVSEFKGVLQIVNPTLNPTKRSDNGLIIEYPTVNTVSGLQIKQIINKIPYELWITPIHSYTNTFELKNFNGLGLNECFALLHGKKIKNNIKYTDLAKERLIYEEFLQDQLKILARRLSQKQKDSPIFKINKSEFEKYEQLLPYELTQDQKTSMADIINDFKTGHPMMRIIQGDVGCGKTTVAILSSLVVLHNNYQVALMCPTEQLARQHFKSFCELFKNFNIRPSLLLGSTKTKDKKEIYEGLESGSIRMVIGTHSLIQKNLKFQNLALAIIDEQHKFGVEQRLNLVRKGNGTHCLIMTATPIPRTLQLAQFGDLDISSIKTIPSGRKGIKTRIIKTNNYPKYLSFIKTRISLGEQVYVVVPAIEESVLELKNVEQHEILYKKYFPDLRIKSLHGQLKADEKQQIMDSFNDGKIDILISTSVIEVGINVINATVMSIYNPERFGLSSLHQLRGRVGRGNKSGFCFLVCDDKTSQDGVERLKIMEKTNDGFEIAEADLKIRGEGDLFGVNQSGAINNKRIANVFEHYQIFEQVMTDINQVRELPKQHLWENLGHLTYDEKISTTI